MKAVTTNHGRKAFAAGLALGLALIVAGILSLTLHGCDTVPETQWQPTLAIDTNGHTTWRVVIIGEETADAPVVEIPDYAREVLIIKEGRGSVRAHLSPDNQDFLLTDDQDTVRFTMR